MEGVDTLEQFFGEAQAGAGWYSGWRCEGFSAGPEEGASVGEVVKHEREVNGKDIEVSADLLAEMDERGLWAADVVWVCRSGQEAVLRYGEVSFAEDNEEELSEEAFAAFKGDLGEASEVLLGPQALVLGTDDEGGYLVLMDAAGLKKETVEAFKETRRVGPVYAQLELN
jgi:hypothetical protein